MDERDISVAPQNEKATTSTNKESVSSKTGQNNTIVQPIQPKTERNSLIEFYRFLLAFWIAFAHGFFPGANGHDSSNFSRFQIGGVGIVLFYQITGFFLMATVIAQNNKPFWNGLFAFTKRRVKNLGFITLVGIILTIWLIVSVYGRTDIWNKPHDSNIFDYIWYVLTAGSLIWFILGLISGAMFFFTLYRICRRNVKIFLPIVSCVVLLCATQLHVLATIDSGMAIFSSLNCMGIGILISYIPKVRCHIAIKWILTIVTFLTTLYFASLPKTYEWNMYVLIIVFFPMLIYFSSQVDLPKENIIRKAFLYLGSLSLPIYMGQSIIYITNIKQASESLILFVLLLTLAILSCKQKFSQLFFSQKTAREEI